MKRPILIIIFVFQISYLANADDLLIPSVGDFVYYSVQTESREKLIGLAYFNPNLFRIRIYEEPNTGSSQEFETGFRSW